MNLTLYENQRYLNDTGDYGERNELWNEFRQYHNFSSTKALFSNSENPLYTGFAEETKKYIEKNHNIFPSKFVNGNDEDNINYCPTHMIENDTFQHPKFLKWAQRFYGIYRHC